ncbi:MAG TPA: hypothetical protein DEG44_01105 [Candidatus Kerfeldbacteria bacterium]|nr:hypothetical protein [Candidatus Kerfeldbacteria bacterium]
MLLKEIRPGQGFRLLRRNEILRADTNEWPGKTGQFRVHHTVGQGSSLFSGEEEVKLVTQ